MSAGDEAETKRASVRPCSCYGTAAAKFQDERYGPGMRVHTVGKRSRCTVCGRES